MVDDSFIIKKFQDHMELFEGNGGSTKNLLDKCIIIANEAFITFDDFNKGFETFIKTSKKNSLKICKSCQEHLDEKNNIKNCHKCSIKNSFDFYS